MSAGPFEIGSYSSNSGRIYACRPQPETKELTIDGVANAYPTGAVTEEVSARLSGGRKKIGCNARYVTIRFTGTPPATYEAGQNLRVPCFQEAIWNAATLGATGSYLAAAIEVRGRTSEELV